MVIRFLLFLLFFIALTLDIFFLFYLIGKVIYIIKTEILIRKVGQEDGTNQRQ